MTAAHSITCPSCGGTIAIKAAGYSVTVACQYCGSVLDVANPDVKVIEEYHQAALSLPLPLGSRGNLFEVEWEVVGYLSRGDGEANWSEYLLFNPYAGYRWLVHAEGDWQYGTMLFDQPDGDNDSVTWRGRRFTRDYPPAATTTDRVVGEFYWRVRAGDSVQAMTYSRGDETLSVEWGTDEANWTQLVGLREHDLLVAFGLATAAPEGAGAAPTNGLMSRMGSRYQQADGMRESDLSVMFLLAAGTSLLILLIMAAFGYGTSSVSNSVQIAVDGPEKSTTVGSLVINRPYQFVTVTARTTDFTNRWVDLDYSLVDRQTQQSIEASGTVEYYAGRDSDGDWTEGSHQTVTKFAGVPRGTYDIVVDTSAHTWSDGTYQSASSPWSAPEAISVYIKADAGGLIWSNYFALLFGLFGLPGLIAWYRSRGED